MSRLKDWSFIIDVVYVNIYKIIVFDAVVSGDNENVDTKCYIGYETDNVLNPLFIEVPQLLDMTVYTKNPLHGLYNQG